MKLSFEDAVYIVSTEQSKSENVQFELGKVISFY